MKQASTQHLFSYWNDLRAGRSAPERSLVDPIAIRGCLADTFMLEHEAPDAYAMRLTGSRVNALFDRSLKGEPFLSLWDGLSQADLGGLASAVMGQACVLVGAARADAGPGASLDLELLLLPLRHHGKTHARLLGALVPLELPAWLGIVPVARLALVSWRLLGQENLTPSLLSRAPPNPAPARPHLARRNHLFVHEGGRQGPRRQAGIFSSNSNLNP